ncbi:type II toxin-antitoxin system PemK/MazF family toxin [Nonomuraea endophytica]|uniref:mRNA interferase MazF n=1 Tax=Nonomuraea endophytica TaxID=714136 RepID=A0A7W8AAR9_9ACTN|nr:type II toxin-antitoxin system PemK/MazF family toxin [Nonomuraea endophytica]MBB5082219.1 mRNA interferase MazF [Nonomuraea endophytica]
MIFRGAIREVRPLVGARGHEQQGERYGVVIQSDRFATGTVTIALTSTQAGPAIYRPEIEFDGVKTRILTDQIYSVDPVRLGAFKGGLQSHEIAELDRAIMLKLGLI